VKKRKDGYFSLNYIFALILKALLNNFLIGVLKKNPDDLIDRVFIF